MHKKIFFPSPKFTLSQYVTQQMNIMPVHPNEIDRRTPEVVRLILTQLEMIKLSKVISTEKILASFYDLNNLENFEKAWDDSYEKTILATKKNIDDGEFKVSKETDTRVLCQILLDFLEHLLEPAISEITISQLSRLVNSGLSSHDILSDQLGGSSRGIPVIREGHKVDPSYKKINKNELVIIERFKKFAATMIEEADGELSIHIDCAVDRYPLLPKNTPRASS